MSALDTFFSAWQETDADTRLSLITEALSPDAVYSDPRSGGRLTGAAAISDYVGMFSANAPGWRASVVAEDEINGFHRALIAFGGMGPDGTEMVQHGSYFAQTDGSGKITCLAGFVGVQSLP